VLANDKDFEGDALHISAINGQAIAVGGTVVLGDGSSVTLNANQTLTLIPTAPSNPWMAANRRTRSSPTR
jgi:hypothetical protein